MRPLWMDEFGNPSSVHTLGSRTARQVCEARRVVATLLGAGDETEIIFTSGGTESNNTAIRSALFTSKGKQRVVTTAVEHSSILKPCRALEEEGVEVFYCPVSGEGDLDLEKFHSTLLPETTLVSVMTANHETGVIFPIEEIAQEVHSRGILFHVDAVQAVGKIPLSLKNGHIDFLSLSAHKFGGPKGIGALYVKKNTPFHPLCFGGLQERGRRAGTENVPGIIGLSAALKRLQKTMEDDMIEVRRIRDLFERRVLEIIPSVQLNGNRGCRLANTSNLAFEGVNSEALLILLDEAGIYASSGSACLSGSPEPSHVLKAMGFSNKRAKSSVRFSFGPENTEEEINATVDILERSVKHLRKIEFREQHPHSVVQ